MSIGRYLFCFVFIALVLTNALYGQGLTGQISGTVQDQSGAVVAGATVELTNEGTNQTRKANTDTSGSFLFAQLFAGSYRIAISAAGFKKYEEKNIVLDAAQRLAVRPVSLELGAIAESVAVTANAEALQTQSVERSSTLNPAQIQVTPTKGLNYLTMTNLLPGVVNTDTPDSPTHGASGLRVNGSRTGAVALFLDGISLMDVGSGQLTQATPSTESIAEMKVMASNYQAEYGRSYGGMVNTVTKSGTSTFHGGVYDYFRNEAMNANNFFSNRNNLARPYYRYNFIGYSLSGPVLIPKLLHRRDKLFFYFNQEFRPFTATSGMRQATFPTALERAGDFSQTVDTNGKMIPINDPLNNKSPFPGNVIPGSRIDPVGQKLLSLFPMPNTYDPSHVFNTVYQGPMKYPDRAEVLRIDYNISKKDTFYIRLSQQRWDYDSVPSKNGGPDWHWDWAFAESFPLMGGICKQPGHGLTATLIHTFTPNTMNEATVGIQRFTQSETVTPAEDATANRATLGIAFPQFYPQNNPYNVVPNASFSGVQSAPSISWETRFPFVGTNTIKTFSDNLTLVRGRHNIKLGIYIERTSRNATGLSSVGQTFPGTVAYGRDVNNPLDSNYAFSNAMLGTIATYSESDKRWVGRGRLGSTEGFIQDSWKVTKRATLDLGMRFYSFIYGHFPYQPVDTFQTSLYNKSQAAQLIQPYLSNGTRIGINPVTGQTVPAVLIGTLAPGSGTFFQGMQAIDSGEILRLPPVNLGPRLGFAWDVFGDGKTAVRGGFGITPGYIGYDDAAAYLVLPPNQKIFTVNYTTIKDLTNSPTVYTPGATLGIQWGIQPPQVYSYSFGIQRDVGFGTVLDVAMVGSLSRHLQQQRSLNATPYGTNFLASSIDQTVAGGKTPLPANFLRPYTGYSDIRVTEFEANAHYTSLQVSLNRRLRRGMSIGGSWTWSKTMDIQDGNSAVNPFLNTHDRYYGMAGYDMTHILVINYNYMLPKLSKAWNNAAVRTVGDNWEVSGITTFRSGVPLGFSYTLISGADITGATGSGVDTRVNLTCNPVLSKSQKNYYRAFDTSCIAQPSFASYGIGTAPKYAFRGPGTNNFDLTLNKHFPLRADGRPDLMFRAEAYNAFNHTQMTGVNTAARFDANGNQTNTLFGQYTAAAAARALQLSLRVSF